MCNDAFYGLKGPDLTMEIQNDADDQGSKFNSKLRKA